MVRPGDKTYPAAEQERETTGDKTQERQGSEGKSQERREMTGRTLTTLILILLLAVLGHTIWHHEMTQILNFAVQLMTGSK